jgi:hypothetical protein
MPSPIRTLSPRPTRLLAATFLTTLLSSVDLLPPVSAQERPGRNLASPPLVADQGLSINDDWDTLIADVTVATRRVTRRGEPAGFAAAPWRYRLERSRTPSGWRTAFTVQSPGGRVLLTPSGSTSSDDSNEIARIEDDEDGSSPRFYDRRGRRVSAPAGALAAVRPTDVAAIPQVSRRRSVHHPGSDSSWVHGLLATPLERSERRAALERSHGRAVGQVRGLDRYLSADGDRVREVLVDPASALAVEINVTRAGMLLSQRVTSYVPGADGTQVKRRVRSERLLSDESGTRAITEIEFTSVRLERRR